LRRVLGNIELILLFGGGNLDGFSWTFLSGFSYQNAKIYIKFGIFVKI
jgi:hypothetical protein